MVLLVWLNSSNLSLGKKMHGVKMHKMEINSHKLLISILLLPLSNRPFIRYLSSFKLFMNPSLRNSESEKELPPSHHKMHVLSVKAEAISSSHSFGISACVGITIYG